MIWFVTSDYKPDGLNHQGYGLKVCVVPTRPKPMLSFNCHYIKQKNIEGE